MSSYKQICEGCNKNRPIITDNRCSDCIRCVTCKLIQPDELCDLCSKPVCIKCQMLCEGCDNYYCHYCAESFFCLKCDFKSCEYCEINHKHNKRENQFDDYDYESDDN